MDAGAVADDLSREESAIPGGLGELLGSLLAGIFGGTTVPRQAGPYDAYHDPMRSEREVAPGRSNPDW
jgi:hypothetical protein